MHIIDCLGRKSNYYLNEAQNIYKMYVKNNENIYLQSKLKMLTSLLSSCRIHSDIITGKRIFEMITF